MDRDEYLKAAQRVIDAAERNAPDFAGECDQCKWCDGGRYPKCMNPIVILAVRNQTDHYAKPSIHTCGTQRDRESLYGTVVCGPNGALFEPKDTGHGFWGWIFG